MKSNVSEGKLVLGGCDPGSPGGVHPDSVGYDKEPVLDHLGEQSCLCKNQRYTGSSGCAQQIDTHP